MQRSARDQPAGTDARALESCIGEVRAQRAALAALLDDVRATAATGVPPADLRCWVSPAQRRYSERLAEVAATLRRIDRRLEDAQAALRQEEWRLSAERDSAVAREAASGTGAASGSGLSVFSQPRRGWSASTTP
jgi:hypothetical protein